MGRLSTRPLISATLVLALGGCAQASLEPHDWALIEESENGLLLIVDVGSPNCNSVEWVTVNETPTAVSIEILVREEVSEGVFWGGCDSARQLEEHTVELVEPLGDRRLDGCLLGGGGGLWQSRESCREQVES